MTRCKKILTFVICILGINFLIPISSVCAQQFNDLFNKQNLQGWESMACEAGTLPSKRSTNWEVNNGVLATKGGHACLSTLQSFGDCELVIEWLACQGSAGFVSLRNVPFLPLGDFTTDSSKNTSQGTSFLSAVSLRQLKEAAKSTGRWNRYVVKLAGQKAVVSLNGCRLDQVIELSSESKSLTLSAPVGLIGNQGKLSIRAVRLRPINGDEANALLSSLNSHFFKPIFNGKNFKGWTGAINDFEIVDGALVNKRDFHGDIYTQQSYSDFAARLQFKLPPAGNSGLALRYQGQGDPHVGGMCELQILDSEHPSYAELDPRQYHGSPYGIAAAKRGFLRTTGEWNFQEVTVIAKQIRVELNGFVILCVDLSDYHETKDGPLHDLINVKSGHFGIASHLDPVAFQQLSIREISSTEEIVTCP